MNTIGLNIRFLRKKKGWTQDDLATKVGVSRYKIGSYEEGRAVPKISLLQFLSDFFNLSLDELVNYELWTSSAPDLLTTPDKTGSNLRILTTVIDKQNDERVVLVPEKASAGYTSGYSDPDFIERLPAFDLPLHELRKDRTYRVFQTKGQSMLPIASGSYIICEYLVDYNEIEFGKPHIVVTLNDGIVFKRIEKDGENAENITLKSDNLDYEPYTIHFNDVIEIWKAVGFISTEFPSPKDVSINRLQNLVSKLDDELKTLK